MVRSAARPMSLVPPVAKPADPENGSAGRLRTRSPGRHQGSVGFRSSPAIRTASTPIWRGRRTTSWRPRNSPGQGGRCAARRRGAGGIESRRVAQATRRTKPAPDCETRQKLSEQAKKDLGRGAAPGRRAGPEGIGRGAQAGRGRRSNRRGRAPAGRGSQAPGPSPTLSARSNWPKPSRPSAPPKKTVRKRPTNSPA